MDESIDPSYFYELKRSLERSKSITQSWLNDFCLRGFVIEYRKQLDEMQLVQRLLLEMLFRGWKKEDSGDPNIILSIINEMIRVSKRLQGLALGSPILAQMKAMLDI